MGERRSMMIRMNRMRYQDEAGWNRMMGWENDQVQVSIDQDAVSRLFVRRVEPGSQSYRVAEVGSANAGDHELPMIRFRQDEHLKATATGQLYATSENPDALTGPFELAVVCP